MCVFSFVSYFFRFLLVFLEFIWRLHANFYKYNSHERVTSLCKFICIHKTKQQKMKEERISCKKKTGITTTKRKVRFDFCFDYLFIYSCSHDMITSTLRHFLNRKYSLAQSFRCSHNGFTFLFFFKNNVQCASMRIRGKER